jgi:hypothetical protein
MARESIWFAFLRWGVYTLEVFFDSDAKNRRMHWKLIVQPELRILCPGFQLGGGDFHADRSTIKGRPRIRLRGVDAEREGWSTREMYDLLDWSACG